MTDNPILREGRALGSAVRFLTRVAAPLPSTHKSWRVDLIRSPRYFPFVGAIIGAVTGVTFYVASHVLPLPIAAAMALSFEALLTGAFHEDALADFTDAFGTLRTPERTLEVLGDSRVGVFGVVAVVMVVLVRVAALVAMAPVAAAVALVVAGTVARAAVVVVMAVVPPVAGRESLARDVGGRVSVVGVVVAVVTAVVVVVGAVLVVPALFPVAIPAAIAVMIAIALYITRLMKRRLGGVVGDGLGAIAMAGQAGIMAALCVKI